MNSIEVSGADNDQGFGGEAAIGEGEKPAARGVAVSQSSKASICTVLKIKLVTEIQMTLPFGCRTPNDIDSPSFSSSVPSNPVRFPSEQDCESTIHMSFPFIVNFKTSLPELLCI